MKPFYGLHDDVRPLVAILCGLQHVLAMFVGIVTPPLIIAGSLGLSLEVTGVLVSMALLTSGVTTFVQVRRFGPIGSGMLSVQGTSFTFVPLAIQAGAAGGLPLILGMTIAGSPLEMVLSRFIQKVRRLFPPVVTGSVVMLIGISLIEVGMTDLAGGFGAEDFGSPRQLGLGAFVMLVIVVCNRAGPGWVRTVSIAIGLGAGYLAAVLLGRVDFSAVAGASWVSLPRPLQFGLAFEPAYLLPWLIGYLVTSMESIGDLTATSEVSREPVRGPVFIRRLQGGILADSLGSLLAGLFNSMPNTTFSQNNGVIALTGVAARRVGLVVAGMLALLGLFPKIAALISVMPKPVLGGATIVMFAVVAVAGFRIVAGDGLTPRKQFILAVTLALGLGITLVPEAMARIGEIGSDTALGRAIMPSVAVVLRSGLAVGAIVAAVLNVLLPDEESSQRGRDPGDADPREP
ncbi:MAG: purine permease [Deltaproteobacteria bacterium]|jgi:NCS2 family nucleobase:cation symporter-2/xanthine permease XanP|nr:purine permease [Deltaproteobacteria bacterium]MBW2533459.1 purine permease [Deltaproteobacteria bacterium]